MNSSQKTTHHIYIIEHFGYEDPIHKYIQRLKRHYLSRVELFREFMLIEFVNSIDCADFYLENADVFTFNMSRYMLQKHRPELLELSSVYRKRLFVGYIDDPAGVGIRYFDRIDTSNQIASLRGGLDTDIVFNIIQVSCSPHPPLWLNDIDAL